MNKLSKVLIATAVAGAFGFGVGTYFDMAPPIMGGALAALTFIYGILLIKEHHPPKEKGFIKNLAPKIPVVVVIGTILWFGAGHFGFPIWWQIEFVAFAFVGLFFFIILDLKTLKVEKGEGHSIRRLIGTYAFGSVLFIFITAQLPQFSPEIELAKLNRPPVDLSGLAGPEVIAAGRDVFESNKCFNCHKEQKGPFVFVHDVMRDGCGACHDPHGSINDKLLIAGQTTTCMNCHWEVKFNTAQGNLGNFPHGFMAGIGAGEECIDCHTAPHGSNISRSFRR